jgi:hypothetical protein
MKWSPMAWILRTLRRQAGLVEGLDHAGAEASDRQVFFQRQDAGARGEPRQQLHVERLGESGVGHAAGDAAARELVGRRERDGNHRAVGQQHQVPALPQDLALADRDGLQGLVQLDAQGDAARVAHHEGFAGLDRRVEDMLQLVLVLGRGDRHVRNHAAVRDVEDALVRLSVVADQPRPVDADRHRQVLERDVVDELVEGALEERRVDRHDRLPASLAIPPAQMTACSSAMPTSKTRSGKRFLTSIKPVPSSIAAEKATIFGSFSIMVISVFAKTCEYV